MITNFDKDNLKEIRTELNSAFDRINDLMGIDLSIANISFTGSKFTCRLTGLATDGEGGVVDQAAEDFKRRSMVYGVPASALGAMVTINHTEGYELVGLNPRAKKFPFIVQDSLGKRYKVSAWMISNQLKDAAA